MSSSSRVSIPSSVKKMIQNIKEITGSHTDDEIYAMLKECAMDPNETTQKLLLEDPFHEVRRKRDRKKENLNKEPAESRWKPGMQGRGKGGRGSYPSRYASQDAGGSRNSLAIKENGIKQVSDDGGSLPVPTTPQDKKSKETILVASAPAVVADCPTDIVSESNGAVPAPHLIPQSEVSVAVDGTNLEGPPPIASRIEATPELVTRGRHGVVSSGDISTSKISAPSSGVLLSSSDPILTPSQESRLSVGTIRREVGSQRIAVEQLHETIRPYTDIKSTPSSEIGIPFMQGKASEFQNTGKTQLPDSSRPTPSTRGGSTVSRPSSNHSSRSQVIGPQKVGPSKEWKPKTTNSAITQGSVIVDSSDASSVLVDTHSQLPPASSVLDLKEVTPELERKLEESSISDSQHVIIPDHLHVPEAEKLGFCFGSFDANFGFGTVNDSVADKSPSISETSEDVEENLDEQSSRNQIALVTADERDYSDRPPSSSNMPETLSSEGDVSSNNAVPEYSESKQETAPAASGHQYPVVHANPNLNFGFVPSMLGSQLPPFESIEAQVRDSSRLPSFVVPQQIDPASYYAQFYRSGADSDGRISPFHSHGVASKYNGNVTVLSPHTSQSSQEVGNSSVLSSAGPTPLATQPASVMQSSIAVSQQAIPVFRQPAGMHLPHYPPNYIPYGPYFSPFYVPPPALHQFLSNGTFPQQPQNANAYSAQPGATAKYPLPQYKPGTNTGNSAHLGMPAGYGPYGSSPVGYNPSSAATAGNSTTNEDLAGAQFKESSVYVTGQQNEGSGVWIATPGRDISGLQSSSFYNLPHGQVAFTPTQAGHGPFAGIYHPAQPVTTGAVHPLLQQSQTMTSVVDMVGPTASVYQQPQPTQINWPNNY